MVKFSLKRAESQSYSDVFCVFMPELCLYIAFESRLYLQFSIKKRYLDRFAVCCFHEVREGLSGAFNMMSEMNRIWLGIREGAVA